MVKIPVIRVSSTAALLRAVVFVTVLVTLLVFAWNRWSDVAPKQVPHSNLTKFNAQNTGAGVSPFGLSAATSPITSTDESVALTPAPVVELKALSRAQNRRATATLYVNGGTARQFVVGDVIAPGIRLTRILPDSIELQRGRNVEQIFASNHQNNSALLTDKSGASANNTFRLPTAEQAFEPSIITPAIDQPAPTSNAVDRAIRRATQK